MNVRFVFISVLLGIALGEKSLFGIAALSIDPNTSGNCPVQVDTSVYDESLFLTILRSYYSRMDSNDYRVRERASSDLKIEIQNRFATYGFDGRVLMIAMDSMRSVITRESSNPANSSEIGRRLQMLVQGTNNFFDGLCIRGRAAYYFRNDIARRVQQAIISQLQNFSTQIANLDAEIQDPQNQIQSQMNACSSVVDAIRTHYNSPRFRNICKHGTEPLPGMLQNAAMDNQLISPLDVAVVAEAESQLLRNSWCVDDCADALGFVRSSALVRLNNGTRSAQVIPSLINTLSTRRYTLFQNFRGLLAETGFVPRTGIAVSPSLYDPADSYNLAYYNATNRQLYPDVIGWTEPDNYQACTLINRGLPVSMDTTNGTTSWMDEIFSRRLNRFNSFCAFDERFEDATGSITFSLSLSPLTISATHGSIPFYVNLNTVVTPIELGWYRKYVLGTGTNVGRLLTLKVRVRRFVRNPQAPQSLFSSQNGVQLVEVGVFGEEFESSPTTLLGGPTPWLRDFGQRDPLGSSLSEALDAYFFFLQ